MLPWWPLFAVQPAQEINLTQPNPNELMPDTTKQANIQDARTPEDALKIARARAAEQMEEYSRKSAAAASEGNEQLADACAANEDGLARTVMFLGNLLHELNEHS